MADLMSLSGALFSRFIRQGKPLYRHVHQSTLLSRSSVATTASARVHLPSHRLGNMVGSAWGRMMSENGGTRRIVGHWLVATSGLVFGIVVLGGLTRLTESGLSMVDWSLLHFRAPKTDAEWQAYFEKYQQFPEYQLNNRGMTVEEFKRIYWFEHAHRVYGRLLGMFVVFPATFFVLKKWAAPGMRKVLMGCMALVGVQGLLGWYMVKSGLRREIVERGEQARVSPYRLAAHLGSAFVLYLVTLSAGIAILAPSSALRLAISTPEAGRRLMGLRRWTHHLAGLTFATAITGAFVAGLDAGLLYNTFPLMGDRVVPTDIWIEALSWKNLTENPCTVQFIHRCMAIATVTGVSSLWISSRRLVLPATVRRALNLVMAAAWMQGSLGVLTLLYMVPIPVASAHQAGSLALLSSFVWLLNVLKRAAL